MTTNDTTSSNIFYDLIFIPFKGNKLSGDVEIFQKSSRNPRAWFENRGNTYQVTLFPQRRWIARLIRSGASCSIPSLISPE